MSSIVNKIALSFSGLVLFYYPILGWSADKNQPI